MDKLFLVFFILGLSLGCQKSDSGKSEAPPPAPPPTAWTPDGHPPIGYTAQGTPLATANLPAIASNAYTMVLPTDELRVTKGFRQPKVNRIRLRPAPSVLRVYKDFIFFSADAKYIRFSEGDLDAENCDTPFPNQFSVYVASSGQKVGTISGFGSIEPLVLTPGTHYVLRWEFVTASCEKLDYNFSVQLMREDQRDQMNWTLQ